MDDDRELQAAIAAGRRELAQTLGDLPARSWEVQSLCAGWRVREVVAHLTMPFRYSGARFLVEVARSGGNFNRMADRCARRDAAVGPGQLAAALRGSEHHPWKPPGGGFKGALTHDVIHGLDITVALDLDHRVPEDRMRTVLGAITEPRSLKFFGTDLSGTELSAVDMDWSFGSGTPVFGTAQDLALVLCGRKLSAGRLRGEASAEFLA